MEAQIEKAGFEVDITREDCLKKRSNFFHCVIDKKRELTKNLTNEQWRHYTDEVTKIQFDCFAANGMAKCETFFQITDYKY